MIGPIDLRLFRGWRLHSTWWCLCKLNCRARLQPVLIFLTFNLFFFPLCCSDATAHKAEASFSNKNDFNLPPTHCDRQTRTRSLGSHDRA